MSLGFTTLSDTCFGCKTCQMACANEKLLVPGVFLRRVRGFDAGDAPKHAFLSMACNHCDDPACLAICPVGAYTKNADGLVIQVHELCIGCQQCINACPFPAPAFCEDEKKTYKCDGCVDRQAAGMEPRCVDACPAGNIRLGEFDNLDGESAKDLAETKPNLKVRIDEDIQMSVISDIDAAPKLVDAGGEGY